MESSFVDNIIAISLSDHTATHHPLIIKLYSDLDYQFH